MFTESYEIELPAAMNVLSVPSALELRSSVQTYRADCALRNNTLVAQRVFAGNQRGVQQARGADQGKYPGAGSL